MKPSNEFELLEVSLPGGLHEWVKGRSIELNRTVQEELISIIEKARKDSFCEFPSKVYFENSDEGCSRAKAWMDSRNLQVYGSPPDEYPSLTQTEFVNLANLMRGAYEQNIRTPRESPIGKK